MPVVWKVSPRQAWTPGMKRYESAVRKGVHSQLQYWAPVVEEEAKRDAPWTDRTANARQTLHGMVTETPDKTRLSLGHGVDYGLWLEIANGGRYGIVKKVLERHYGDIMQSIRDLLK